MGHITTVSADIKGIIKNYYEKFCTHKCDILDLIVQFLKKIPQLP